MNRLEYACASRFLNASRPTIVSVIERQHKGKQSTPVHRRSTRMKRETVSLVLVNLAGIMERADESLLPGVYKEVGAALHADPTRLGSLTLFRSVVQSSCYPLAAYLAARHNRAHVIALGAFLWAAATFLVAISTTFAQVAISRGLNGIGLAIATPAIQSLVADSTTETNRGTAFGWLHFTGSFGSILGNLIAVLLASSSFMGIAGWRLAFHLVAALSVAIGVLLRLFATDPSFESGHHSTTRPFLEEMKELIEEAKLVIRTSSFQVLVIQGVFGTFPWSSLSFMPMWLELVGFSHKTTASILTLFSVATALGALFGGKMGDAVAQRLPNSGRIMLSQISSASAIPLAAILLLGLPDDPSTAAMHGFVFFVMGLFISWNAAATNNPIFAEIVPERARTSIYALDRSFESMLASFAPPVVGVLAQHVYGYKPLPDSGSRAQVGADRANAESLGKALYTAIGIPMVICVSFYSLLYYTYPRDRDRARMHALIESELNHIQLEDGSFDLVRESVYLDCQTHEDKLEYDEVSLLTSSEMRKF